MGTYVWLRFVHANPIHVFQFPNCIQKSHIHVYSNDFCYLYKCILCSRLCVENSFIIMLHFMILFVCFVALRPKSTAMVIAGRSVHLTTLFPVQA